MKRKWMILTACTMVVLAGCSKENVSPLKVASSSVTAQNLRFVDPAANAANPVDSIGRLHNLILDSLRHYYKRTGDTTWAGNSRYLSDYFKKYRGVTVKQFHNPALLQAVCKDYKAVFMSAPLTDASLKFMGMFADALAQINDLDHYSVFKGRIMDAEAMILKADIPESERTKLLMTASVLRYSGYYWMGAFANGSVTQHPVPDGFFRKVAGVIVGIAADASVLAFNYIFGYDNILDGADTMSECCGYYTGWY
ncbi:hypothetical protein MTO98_09490 [Mucilaginibacter sp. SMC90]|uniref:hypothetical protein n=1 Tax=Mucilaginibacter sp. SMC90 TaxID=2929803 RepID=UPI001FB3FE08|nr:hypothetical protein [Mucilaginibacter sp. SMC90]UOE51310.1 hypothetical protein MTO98_09490 [Mucilaginibacter sp. SMC90]